MNNKISVRLNDKAMNALNGAVAHGYKTSAFINELLSNYNVASTTNIESKREIIAHICNIESLLEFEKDSENRKEIREELNGLCRCLNM